VPEGAFALGDAVGRLSGKKSVTEPALNAAAAEFPINGHPYGVPKTGETDVVAWAFV